MTILRGLGPSLEPQVSVGIQLLLTRWVGSFSRQGITISSWQQATAHPPLAITRHRKNGHSLLTKLEAVFVAGQRLVRLERSIAGCRAESYWPLVEYREPCLVLW
jgi:hypothetical protein